MGGRKNEKTLQQQIERNCVTQFSSGLGAIFLRVRKRFGLVCADRLRCELLSLTLAGFILFFLLKSLPLVFEKFFFRTTHLYL